jgi:hypothetical protein
MRHYATYFDRRYLAQGLALWRSLARHDAAAELWVLALDGLTAEVLHGLGESRLHVVPQAVLLDADRELAGIARGRTPAEFIFAHTSCWIRWLLQTQAGIETVAYVDADLFFHADPAPAWRELEDASVVVSPHRYPPWHDDSSQYGRFNVGWLLFRRDAAGAACLEHWRARCLESCALTADGQHYGDQKYLDAWPTRFGEAVRVSSHAGVDAAPWNWARHRWTLAADGTLAVDGAPLIVFHYAQFRWIRGAWWDSGQLEYGVMPLWLRSRLYGAYAVELRAAEAAARTVRADFALLPRGWRETLGPWHLAWLRLFWGQCWRQVGPWWIAGRFGLGRFSGRFMAVYRRMQRRHR